MSSAGILRAACRRIDGRGVMTRLRKMIAVLASRSRAAARSRVAGRSRVADNRAEGSPEVDSPGEGAVGSPAAPAAAARHLMARPSHPAGQGRLGHAVKPPDLLGRETRNRLDLEQPIRCRETPHLDAADR